MAIVGTIAAVAGAGAAVVGTVQAHNAQQRAARAQQQQQDLANIASTRASIRQTQILAAQAQASAVGAGSQFGSGAAGGIGSLSSQLGTQMGYASQMGELSDIVSKNTMAANTWGGIAHLGESAFYMGARLGGLRQIIHPATSAGPAFYNPGVASGGYTVPRYGPQ